MERSKTSPTLSTNMQKRCRKAEDLTVKLGTDNLPNPGKLENNKNLLFIKFILSQISLNIQKLFCHSYK